MWTRVINRGPGDMDLFRSQLNRLFSDFDDSYAGFGQSGATFPYTNMYDDGEKLTLLAEVPGMSRDELQVKIQGNYLELSGGRETKVPEGYKAHRVERRGSSFTRSFTLTTDVVMDRIEAELDDGILTLTMPKAAAAKAKQIEIK